MSYESLCRNLRAGAEAARSSIECEPGGHNDAGQAVKHLTTLVDMLDEIDVSSPEEPSSKASLSAAVSHGRDIVHHVDYFEGDLGQLAEAVSAAEDAGFIANTPDNEWFNGDTPPNGESWN